MEARRHFDMSSSESEDRFRQIFFAHLKADGYTDADAYRLIFKTPRPFHEAPSQDHGLKLLDAFRESYQRQLAYSWYFEGLNQKSESDARFLQAPVRPVTFVVITGIFGEFIDQLPFQSVVSRMDSHFCRKWQASLEQASDKTYSLLELTEKPCRLADVVEIGSLDQAERSFANVIVLRAKAGSLETLGSLASNAAVLQRRLTKVFEAIKEDSDIYLLGYSRGLAVALDLVSHLHAQNRKGELSPAARTWFEKVKGVVGFGGIFYGANFAQDVLAGTSGVTSDLVKLIVETSTKLVTVPNDANLATRTRIVGDNAKIWAELVKRISGATAPKIAAGKAFLGLDLEDTAAKESRARILGRDVPVPNPWGIFSLVNHFFLKTFALNRLVSHYNENILAFKQLVEAVVSGLNTLTPASRDEWWRSHELPETMKLLSITGIMPDAYLNGFESPLWHFLGFGTHTSDYNVSLRASYYDTLSSENTLINDSQVSHFSSRYWEEMYPEHQYAHYYLGILGTHHWGMALPFTIEDDAKIGANAFPRATLLKSVASFISALDRDRPGR